MWAYHSLPPISKIAEVLGGDVISGQVLAPGPGHNRIDRSLSIKPDPNARDGFVVHSFAGDSWSECRDYVRTALQLPPEGRREPAPRGEPPPGRARDNEASRIASALRIWCEACDPRGTPAWSYLHRRGVDLGALPERIGAALRWHRACLWGRGRHGCIVALWSDAPTGEPRAIHRRPLTSAGENVAHWRALGPTAGCVIRLWPDEEVAQGLVIGEGAESVLGAATRIRHRGTLLQPAWAAGDAGHIAVLPILAGVEALTVLVDHDPAGERAAAECARRWTAAGREVTRLTPRTADTDFNDIISKSAT